MASAITMQVDRISRDAKSFIVSKCDYNKRLYVHLPQRNESASMLRDIETQRKNQTRNLLMQKRMNLSNRSSNCLQVEYNLVASSLDNPMYSHIIAIHFLCLYTLLTLYFVKVIYNVTSIYTLEYAHFKFKTYSHHVHIIYLLMLYSCCLLR